jgi:formylglycine-generating enzyme required for sulfatase activity
MKLRQSIITSTLVTIVLVSLITLPVLAEQASAESADFTVNTIPEPSALIFIVLAGFLFRRMRGAKTLCIAFFALCITMPALQTYAAAPIVTNVVAQQQELLPEDVDIYYDLVDDDGDSNYVHIAVSTNSGALYNVVATNFSGDVGHSILPGTGKHIVWNAAGDIPQYSSSTVRVKITVDDRASSGMAYIPAGSFNMGNCMNQNEGSDNELPVHSVYISAFYMDKYEVTKSKWDEVYTWARVNGYGFDYSGSGKAANHPVQTINWYDCIKWCNARSEKEGKTPCYYTDATKTTVYKTGRVGVSNDWVNWDANGYRLPTEAEWEKAARGGIAGHRFPWSDTDTITHSRANYKSSDSYSYDVSPTIGYHPDYTASGRPYTSPVGSFAPNGYGMYDMAGNVWEWCWDWYGSSYYSSSPESDPRGPASGPYRVLRGGSWYYNTFFTRCAYRPIVTPDSSSPINGLRCVCR